MNQGWIYRDRVNSADHGYSVLAYYLRHQSHSTEEEWRARLAEGRVTCHGKRVTADTKLATDDVLEWARPPWEEPEVPRTFAILYEDDDILAVNKPSGLPVLPGGGYLENTLLHLVQMRTTEGLPIPVHRLGRGTSGVVLFARSALARHNLAEDFREATKNVAGSLRKTYIALTGPAPHLPDVLEITQPIGPVPHPTLGEVHAASATGKSAQSQCRVLRRTPHHTLWEIDLITGRPHQIRIHLAWAGAPLLGDPLYGPGGLPLIPAQGRAPVPGDLGYSLHAHSLELTHPRTGARLTISAPPPAIFGEG